MDSRNEWPENLLSVNEKLYEPCGLTIVSFKAEAESKEYKACTFELGGKRIRHRTSKITPNKTGQFVTLWKRNAAGITEPFADTDDMDLICITSRKENRIGQFIFPKRVLADQGILSQNGKGGKRGFRVYAPWDQTGSKQAEKTQNWQSAYFLDLSSENPIAAIEHLTFLFSDPQNSV